MNIHELKTHPGPFEATWGGTKRAELRKDDRGYVAGDLLHLREWNPEAVITGNRQDGSLTYEGDYTGRSVVAHVTHIVDVDEWVQTTAAWVVLSIDPIHSSNERRS